MLGAQYCARCRWETLMYKQLRNTGLYRFLKARFAAAALPMKGRVLHQVGWRRSAELGRSVDGNGNYVPWWTYGAIDAMDALLQNDDVVLEFGSGTSTFWLCDRVAKITSVEHDDGWAEEVRSGLGATGEVRLAKLDAGYEGEVSVAVEAGRPPTVVIIDGRRRVECTAALDCLASPPRLVVFDNSDRERYDTALADLRAAYALELKFSGLAPGLTRKTTTSVFCQAIG